MALVFESPLASANRGQTLIREGSTTGQGTIVRGFKSASFYNNGSGDATVNGQTVPTGVSKNYPYVGGQYTENIDFDGGGNQLIIVVVWSY